MKMRQGLLLLHALCLFVTGHTQLSTRLNNNWQFLKQDLGGIWEAVRPVPPGGPESVPIWSPVTLPHCVNASDATDPDVNYYQGPAWYRTNLRIENPYPQGRTILHFEGAGQKTSVYVYTTLVGEHTGGYDEFTVDITDAVEAFRKLPVATKQFKGLIPVSIRTDNSRDLEMIPSSMSDFNVYGGIYRYLNLTYVPSLSIDKLFVQATTDAKGLTGSVRIMPRFLNMSKAKTASWEVMITDPAGKEVYKHNASIQLDNADGALEVTLKKPVRWSPADPRLYTVLVRMGDYHFSEKFAFRHFEFVKHGPFMLNGKRLLLNGTHRHEDHAGVAAAMTEDMMRTEMIMMKDMGVNFIRLGHYQQSRIILNLCDSLGILVWEEIPWCRGGLGGDIYKEQARRMLVNMIEQHYNHPSVIIWGLGNENDWPGDFPVFDTLAIRTFMKELNDLSHKMDPSRKTAIRRCDFCRDIVDVYSPSIWAGWYRGIYTEYKQITEAEMKKVDHFLHVEWGGDSHAGRHSETPDKGLQKIKASGAADERAGDASLVGGAARASKDGDWSESYMVNLVDWHLKEQQTMPWLTGTAQWPFKDFSTPLRPDNPVPYVNQKGVVECDLTKKETFYVYQSYWSDKPMIHIYGHTWPVRWGTDQDSNVIKVFSNMETAELFVNGKSLGVKKRNAADFPAAGLRWELPMSSGTYNVSVIGRKGKLVLTDSLSFDYQSGRWGKPVKAELTQTSFKDSIATVEVILRDASGLLCLDNRDIVRFGITGDGTLIENMGTSSGSRVVQLYNGRAIIRVKQSTGRSMVSATVKGLPTVFVEVAANTPDALRPAIDQNSLIEKTTKVLRPVILRKAAWALQQEPVTVTAQTSPRSAGGKHDFFSEGDYWWPDPANPDSPYVQRDGITNPGNFTAHRLAMIRFSEVAGALASAYVLTHEQRYAYQLLRHCRAWFIDTATRMNPNLLYAQAIKGRATGRGIGIIDAIQLMEVVKGLEVIEREGMTDTSLYNGFRAWFREYLAWVTTHRYGIDEMNAKNNHGTCWVMQVAVFAGFTGDAKLLAMCGQRFRDVLLPGQLAADGSFPLELKRTKPYGYSLFNLDAMATICHVLPVTYGNGWQYQYHDSLSMQKAVAFMKPYVANKSTWPFAKDVMYWNEWPVAQPFLLFAASGLGDQSAFDLWATLEHDPKTDEVIRNLPVRNPLIWLVANKTLNK